jgi:hypothetical protein
VTHLLLWFFLLVAGGAQDNPQSVGTKVVWHYTTGTFAGGEVTTYTMADRRRVEYRNTSKNRNPDGSFSIGDPPANVVIQRCDLGQSFGLNTKAREYSEKEYPPKPLTAEERKARGLDDPDWDTSTLLAYRVQTTTVDTGEREEIFGQTARHIITTTETMLLGGAKGEPSALVKDGWYIDYVRRISCEPSEETKLHTFDWLMAGGVRVPTARVERVLIGPPETGLLVRAIQNPGMVTTIKGSNGVDLTLSNDIQVTYFYRGPLDPNLFEVPTGYRLGDFVRY